MFMAYGLFLLSNVDVYSSPERETEVWEVETGRRLPFQYIPLCSLYHVLVLTGKNVIQVLSSTNRILEVEVTTWTQPLHLMMVEGQGS